MSAYFEKIYENIPHILNTSHPCTHYVIQACVSALEHVTCYTFENTPQPTILQVTVYSYSSDTELIFVYHNKSFFGLSLWETPKP